MVDLDHGDYSAVHVLRQWSQQRGEQVTLPVVFTSNLGRELLGENAPGALHYLVSQTPQVWLDCQVMEYQKALLISWDTVDALFPEGMLDQMFALCSSFFNPLSKMSKSYSHLFRRMWMTRCWRIANSRYRVSTGCLLRPKPCIRLLAASRIGPE